MKILKINTKGVWYESKVDDEDYERLSKYRWGIIWGSTNIPRPYRKIRVNGKRKLIQLHREVMKAPVGAYLDHINRDSLDNRKCNLRFCTSSQNQMNKGLQRNNKSGYRGVHWLNSQKKWFSGIKFNHKVTYLGLYDDKKEAARAYDKKAKEIFGEFAYINFP